MNSYDILDHIDIDCLFIGWFQVIPDCYMKQQSPKESHSHTLCPRTSYHSLNLYFSTQVGLPFDRIWSYLFIFVFSTAFLFSIQAANCSDFLWWQPRSKCEQQKLCFAPGQICGSWHAKCQASGNSQRTKPIMLFAASKANSSWLLVGTSLVQEHVACTALRKICQATPWKQSKGSGCTVVVATQPRVSCLPEREWHKLVDMRQECCWNQRGKICSLPRNRGFFQAIRERLVALKFS